MSAIRATTTRSLLAALLLQATSVYAQETGLSKGPVNPADKGTRCAVMAGRDDRAYLNCQEQPAVIPPARDAAERLRPFTDQPDGAIDPRSLGPYLRRDR